MVGKKQRIIKTVLILLIMGLVVAKESVEECRLTSQQIDAGLMDGREVECLQKALRNNWQDMIQLLLTQKQAKYKQEFIQVFQKELKRLEILEQQIVLGTSDAEPVLKWGQNQTHLFITFKLSHRWDSPPCLNTQSQKSKLEIDTFLYENVCLVSHQKVNFRVNLNLYRNVHLTLKNKLQQNKPAQTIYTDYVFQVKKDGVGTFSTILLKKAPQIWLFLTKEETSHSNWHQIGSRYESDFQQYQRSLQTHKLIKKQKAAQQNFQHHIKLMGTALIGIVYILSF